VVCTYRAQGPVELRSVGEVEFANGVAAMAASGTYGRTQICAGIVGYANLTLGAPVEKVLQAMIQAGGGRFRGIRFITASHPEQAAWASAVVRPEGLLMNLNLREGFARLAPLGLSFEAWMYHTQLGELVDLARTFPGNGWQVAPFQVDWQPPPLGTVGDREGALLETAGYQTTASYDSLGRVKNMQFPQDVEGKRRELRPEYNRAGGLDQVSLDDTLYASANPETTDCGQP
jgi:hypothetical protein